MSKKEQETIEKKIDDGKILDVTGAILYPGHPDECEGNGKNGKEICCDECDGFLACFAEYADPEYLGPDCF